MTRTLGHGLSLPANQFFTTMENEKQLTIGEFARLCGVTVKTLRHYEKVGLVVPAVVDDFTHYRYYSPCQMQKMNAIKSLKRLGFHLDEIAEIFDEETIRPEADALDVKIAQATEQIEALRRRLRALKAIRKSYDNKPRDGIEFCALPEIIVAFNRRRISDYQELFDFLPNQLGPEMARLGCECTEPGYCYVSRLSDTYAAGFDIEYAEQVVEAKKQSSLIAFRTVEAVPLAACLNYYGNYDGLDEAARRLTAEVEAMGYHPTAPARYSFVDGIWNQADPAKWLTVVQLPVAK